MNDTPFGQDGQRARASSRNQPGPHRPRPPASGIRAGELIPLGALGERLGWGARTIAKAQRLGLRVLVFGRWKYCGGSDVIEFLERVQGKAGQDEDAGRGDDGGPPGEQAL